MTGSDRFARDAAASTGYVPASIMAAPLIADGECIGVLEVLDRHTRGTNAPGRELDDIELLGLLATQAALSLALLRRGERGERRCRAWASWRRGCRSTRSWTRPTRWPSRC